MAWKQSDTMGHTLTFGLHMQYVLSLGYLISFFSIGLVIIANFKQDIFKNFCQGLI